MEVNKKYNEENCETQMRDLTEKDVEEMRSSAKGWALLAHPMFCLILIFLPILAIIKLIFRDSIFFGIGMLIDILFTFGFVRLYLAPKKSNYWHREANKLEKILKNKAEEAKKIKIEKDKEEAERIKKEELEKKRIENEIIEKAQLYSGDIDFLNEDMLDEIDKLDNCGAIYRYLENINSGDQRYTLIMEKLKGLTEVERWYGNKKEEAIKIIREMHT